MPIFDSTDQDGAAVRAFLRDQARELLQHALDGPGYHDGKPIDPPPPPVDIEAERAVEGSLAWILASLFGYTALRDGREWECCRGDLPPWCPEARVGHPGDKLVLGVDDVLVPV